MLASWPLTGRDEQLALLGRHYRSGEVGGIVLHGPAGAGKTRLAEEAVRLAEGSGRQVQRAVGHPSTAEIPLGALAHLLPGTLVDDLGVGEEERMALFHGARAELRRLAGDDRLVLLVDDFDLLDDTSVAVLVPLIVSRKVFLIGTVRTGGAPAPRVAGLERDGHLARIDVGPLPRDDLGALLHRVLGGAVAPDALAELARLSGGNLQVLRELVNGARERGALVPVDGTWRLIGPLPTTTALEELVASHLAGVDPAGMAVLERLAVCERFGLIDLERMHGALLLERLEAGGLLTVVESGRRVAVRLAHPLYGEVLRAGLAPLRRRRIQQELADVVEAHGARRREDKVQLALWRVSSGGRLPGEQLLAAARLALVGRDAPLAVRLVEAIAAGDGVAAGERAEVLAGAHAMQGDDDAVERIVAEVWDGPLTDAQRAALARRLADTRFSGRRDLDGALAAHEAACRVVSDPEVRAAVDARRAALLAGAGRPLDALAIADAIGPEVAAPTRVAVAAARAASLLSLGRCDEARAISEQAIRDHAELPGWLARRGIAMHVLNQGHALAYCGRYREGRELFEVAAERSRTANALGAWVWFEMGLGEIARDTGRADEAIRRFRAVAAVAPGAGQDAALVWAHVGVAQGHLLQGECAAAARALEQADEVGDSPVATSVATRERTRAWLEACRGELSAARSRVRSIAADVRRDHVYLFEAALLNDLVRLGAPEEAAARLEELAGVIDGPLVQAHARHAEAVVDRDVDLLTEVVERYVAMDALGLAAEAAAELAELHQAVGDGRRANAARQRSAELADQAGGVSTPVLARGEAVEPLTAREREVALLAAAGATSREIGERLFLSARTVDTHLARVYRKLGVSGRTELPHALGVGRAGAGTGRT